MELKYDIYTLNNAQGTGEKRQYVRIVQHEPMTEKQLQEKIQNRCSLTKGDVAAVLAELHDLMVEEFSLGRRFYIPEIGYFSMSASLEMPEENPDKKITGKEVRITGIKFRPEGKLMEVVQRNVHFVRSRYSNQSTKYSEEKMLENIKEYLQKNRYITTRMGSSFLHHDTLFAEMVEPLLCHVRSQAKEDAQDASGDIAVLLEILLDFRQ